MVRRTAEKELEDRITESWKTAVDCRRQFCGFGYAWIRMILGTAGKEMDDNS